jgi:hypothetical protein
MSAVAESEPLLRVHRLHDLMGCLDSAQLALLFQSTVQMEDRERRNALLNSLLTRWAALDLEAAAAMIGPYWDRYRAVKGFNWQALDFDINNAWARAQPESALAEAIKTPDAQWAKRTAWIAIQGLAEGDPSRQLEALARLPLSSLRAGMCAESIKALAAQDPAAAEARLDLLPDLRQRARLQAEILGKLTERDPAAGLARLAALAPDLQPGMAGNQLLTTVLRAAAKQDPTAALATINGFPQELQTQALGAVLVGWAGEHPVDALEWAAAQGIDIVGTRIITPSGDGNYNWHSLIDTAFERDHTKTLAWLRTQPASPERGAMLNEGLWKGTPEQKIAAYSDITPERQAAAVASLVQSFRISDPAPLEPWIKEMPPGPARTAAIQNFATLQAARTPEQINTFAEAWSAGADRNAALRGIAISLAYDEPVRALQFARRLEDSNAREATFADIASSWLRADATSARAWLASTPEIPAESKRVLIRQFEER